MKEFKCPHCNNIIDQTELLRNSDLLDEVKSNFEKELEKKEKENKAELEKAKLELANLQNSKDLEIQKIKEETESKLESDIRKKIEQEALGKSKEKEDMFNSTVIQLNSTIENLNKQIKLSNDFLEKEKKEKENLAQEIKNIKDNEETIKQKADAEAHAKYELLLKEEKDRNEKINRTLRENSSQGKGEAFEEINEQNLRELFKDDIFEPVAKGVKGADLVHTVYHNRVECGKILYEFKNTKNYDKEWEKTLQDNFRNTIQNGIFCVLITQALPNEMIKSGDTMKIDGNMVVIQTEDSKNIVSILRKNIIDMYDKNKKDNSDDVKTSLYNYVNSQTFSEHIKKINNFSKELREKMATERKHQESYHNKIMQDIVSLETSMVYIATSSYIIKKNDQELLE